MQLDETKQSFLANGGGGGGRGGMEVLGGSSILWVIGLQCPLHS